MRTVCAQRLKDQENIGNIFHTSVCVTRRDFSCPVPVSLYYFDFAVRTYAEVDGQLYTSAVQDKIEDLTPP